MSYQNAQGTVPVITCRISVDDKSKLVQIAGQNGMGISQYMRQLLEKHITDTMGRQLGLPDKPNGKPVQAIKSVPAKVVTHSTKNYAPEPSVETPTEESVFIPKEKRYKCNLCKDRGWNYYDNTLPIKEREKIDCHCEKGQGL